MKLKFINKQKFKEIISNLKKTIRKLDENKKIYTPYDKAFKRHPQLKPLQNKEDVLKIDAQLNATFWQKIYVIFSIALTFVLIGVTIFYAIQTHELNKMTSNQFKTENRPQIIIDGEIKRANSNNEMMIILPLKNIGKTPANISKITVYAGVSWYNLEQRVYNPPKEISWKIFPQETKTIMLTPHAFSKETIESQLIILRVNTEYYGDGVFTEDILYSDTGNMVIGNTEPTQNE